MAWHRGVASKTITQHISVSGSGGGNVTSVNHQMEGVGTPRHVAVPTTPVTATWVGAVRQARGQRSCHAFSALARHLALRCRTAVGLP